MIICMNSITAIKQAIFYDYQTLFFSLHNINYVVIFLGLLPNLIELIRIESNRFSVAFDSLVITGFAYFFKQSAIALSYCPKLYKVIA